MSSRIWLGLLFFVASSAAAQENQTSRDAGRLHHPPRRLPVVDAAVLNAATWGAVGARRSHSRRRRRRSRSSGRTTRAAISSSRSIFVYPLDGSAKTNTLMLGRGFEQQDIAHRLGRSKLVIVTTQDFPNLVPGQVVTTRVTRSLTLESPTSLVVETTRSGVLGGKESSTRTVYTKG